MATVKEILASKGSQVQTIPASATILEATLCMNEKKIGALVVAEGPRIVGILTERDVLQRVVARERPPRETRVTDVMTTEVICCLPQTDIDEVSRIMKDRRVRHVPVCTVDGALAGIVSIGDLNAHHASHQEATIHFLHEYLYGAA